MQQNSSANLPDDFDDVLNEEMITMKEAKNLAIEYLKTNHLDFYRHIHPRLKKRNRAAFITQEKEGVALANQKLPKSEVMMVIYDIKKKWIDRGKG